MSGFELNKIFAAVLVAGITAMLGGFIAETFIHPHKLEKDAVSIEGDAPQGGSGPQKAAKAEPTLHLVASADIAYGQKLSKACAACHAFDKGGPTKIGPPLWNIVGAKKAAIPGFAYSPALIEHGGVWSYSELNQFLWKPKKHIQGTKMNYVGIKKPEARAAMIAWLRTLANSPVSLPSSAEIAAEAPQKIEEAAQNIKDVIDVEPQAGDTLEGFEEAEELLPYHFQ